MYITDKKPRWIVLAHTADITAVTAICQVCSTVLYTMRTLPRFIASVNI